MKAQFIKYNGQIQNNSSDVQKLNRDSIYVLGSEEWEQKKMSKICPFIAQWKSRIFQFTNIQNIIILKELAHIEFSQIQSINLNNNKIESIEGLNRVWMPTLQKLQLWENRIVCLREFRKISFQFLQNLHIYDNRMSEGESLGRAKMAQEIQKIYFEPENNREHIHDNTWICKFEPPIVKQIDCKQIQIRVHQNKLTNVIERKYKNEWLRI